ncbi:glycosyltransferase, partial [Kineococcus glutinatus]|uniref:glycosyltransferase n=1 Tax=Kineococcus glutinatus TaxID=1070872 RepID=UPI0031EFF5A5
VNLQWPEWALAGERAAARRGLRRLLARCRLARALGHRILLTVHNTRGHDVPHPALERVMWRSLALLATHLHTFTAAGAAEFVREVPAARRLVRVVIPHGDYRPVVGPVPDRSAARRRFGLEPRERVLLTFGRLRPYKGLDAVLDAFTAGTDPHERLLLCGAPEDEDTAEHLRAAARRDPRIVLVPRFLAQEELTAAVTAADAVVLPYRRVTNSGSALMALTLGRPVLLPATPVFEELRQRVGADWVHLVPGRLEPQHLRAATAVGAQREAGAGPDLSWCSWDAVSVRLAALL